jgi:hypothetical protein
LAPDGTPCQADAKGLLRRAHILAGRFRYIGKETDHNWEQGDDFSVLEFRPTEFGRSKMVIPDQSITDQIRAIGIRKTMKLTGMSQHTIEKIVRLEMVKRKTYEHVQQSLRTYKTARNN